MEHHMKASTVNQRILKVMAVHLLVALCGLQYD